MDRPFALKIAVHKAYVQLAMRECSILWSRHVRQQTLFYSYTDSRSAPEEHTRFASS